MFIELRLSQFYTIVVTYTSMRAVSMVMIILTMLESASSGMNEISAWWQSLAPDATLFSESIGYVLQMTGAVELVRYVCGFVHLFAVWLCFYCDSL